MERNVNTHWDALLVLVVYSYVVLMRSLLLLYFEVERGKKLKHEYWW